jgi:hypothetical protein
MATRGAWMGIWGGGGKEGGMKEGGMKEGRNEGREG